MIYMTGDLHAEFDGLRLKPENFDYSGLTREDYIFCCGDFGFVWFGDERDNVELDWISQLPVTILFIDGNHENFDALEKYPIQKWKGGNVHFIRENIIHLMRGQYYEIEGKTFFTFGGGKSIDRARRIEGQSWWPQEMPSEEEFETGLRTLEEHNWEVDYIVSHTCPSHLVKVIAPYIGTDRLNDYLMDIASRAHYKHWYLGHYHTEKELDDKHTLFYRSFIPVGDTLSHRERARIKNMQE